MDYEINDNKNSVKAQDAMAYVQALRDYLSISEINSISTRSRYNATAFDIFVKCEMHPLYKKEMTGLFEKEGEKYHKNGITPLQPSEYAKEKIKEIEEIVKKMKPLQKRLAESLFLKKNNYNEINYKHQLNEENSPHEENEQAIKNMAIADASKLYNGGDVDDFFMRTQVSPTYRKQYREAIFRMKVRDDKLERDPNENDENIEKYEFYNMMAESEVKHYLPLMLTLAENRKVRLPKSITNNNPYFLGAGRNNEIDGIIHDGDIEPFPVVRDFFDNEENKIFNLTSDDKKAIIDFIKKARELSCGLNLKWNLTPVLTENFSKYTDPIQAIKTASTGHDILLSKRGEITNFEIFVKMQFNDEYKKQLKQFLSISQVSLIEESFRDMPHEKKLIFIDNLFPEDINGLIKNTIFALENSSAHPKVAGLEEFSKTANMYGEVTKKARDDYQKHINSDDKDGNKNKRAAMVEIYIQSFLMPVEYTNSIKKMFKAQDRITNKKPRSRSYKEVINEANYIVSSKELRDGIIDRVFDNIIKEHGMDINVNEYVEKNINNLKEMAIKTHNDMCIDKPEPVVKPVKINNFDDIKKDKEIASTAPKFRM